MQNIEDPLITNKTFLGVFFIIWFKDKPTAQTLYLRSSVISDVFLRFANIRVCNCFSLIQIPAGLPTSFSMSVKHVCGQTYL